MASDSQIRDALTAAATSMSKAQHRIETLDQLGAVGVVAFLRSLPGFRGMSSANLAAAVERVARDG